MLSCLQIAVGFVDGKAESQLMRKMRITNFPVAKLFFPNGDMFDFNPSELKTVKAFAMFLFRQMNPPWVSIESVDKMLRVFMQAPRVALGIFDEEEKIPTGIRLTSLHLLLADFRKPPPERWIYPFGYARSSNEAYSAKPG